MDSSLLIALARYVRVLSDAAAQTTRSEDRPKYRDHLAAAAQMFRAVVEASGSEELKRLVAAERHSYGWSYLADEVGDRVEHAFDELAKLVESVN